MIGQLETCLADATGFRKSLDSSMKYNSSQLADLENRSQMAGSSRSCAK